MWHRGGDGDGDGTAPLCHCNCKGQRGLVVAAAVSGAQGREGKAGQGRAGADSGINCKLRGLGFIVETATPLRAVRQWQTGRGGKGHS